jgi:hypothetical protein
MAINISREEMIRKFPKVNGILSETSLIAAGYEGLGPPDDMNSRTFINAITWCDNNIQGEYQYIGGKFWFTDNRDSVAFKMVWL